MQSIFFYFYCIDGIYVYYQRYHSQLMYHSLCNLTDDLNVIWGKKNPNKKTTKKPHQKSSARISICTVGIQECA